MNMNLNFAENFKRLRKEKGITMPLNVIICENMIEADKYFASLVKENLNRGLVAVHNGDGNVSVTWRYLESDPIDIAFDLYRKSGDTKSVKLNSEPIAASTFFKDSAVDTTVTNTYMVVQAGEGNTESGAVYELTAERAAKPYLEIPVQPVEGFEYGKYYPSDGTVADLDGDGDLELVVKMETRGFDNAHAGLNTEGLLLDAYELSGEFMWRVDLGLNIRQGAHYTQFMVCDFDGDGKAEMSVKTAPGSRMTRYNADGSIREQFYVTMPESDLAAGYSHQDNYVCSGADYRRHVAEMFMGWHQHPEVVRGQWPATLEACFGIDQRYDYPLTQADAEALADYFITEYAPARSPRNQLEAFEGFIYEGPEYLSLFAGDGSELETIPFPFPRLDDGLMWGDYAWNRIEPCNRVDRFLSGVAYLDGVHPSLIICRGYYTRSCIAAYDVVDGKHQLRWSVDSGFLPMQNPFKVMPGDAQDGTDPVYGKLARQGNHSLSCADVDGDGCMEIIYGAACIDHDGSLLYSSTSCSKTSASILRTSGSPYSSRRSPSSRARTHSTSAS